MKVKKLVFGVGVNDLESATVVTAVIDGVRKIIWRCPFYRRWSNMLRRCYAESSKRDDPTYEDCYVCDEWLYFSKFKAWMEQQDWQDKQLDKDLLVQGNRVYSGEACVFVEQSLNLLLRDNAAIRGKYSLGVSWYARDSNYHAQIKVKGKQIHLGYHTSELDAHRAWQKAKRQLLLNEVGKHGDTRIDDALMLRVNQLQHDLDNHQITRRL